MAMVQRDSGPTTPKNLGCSAGQQEQGRPLAAAGRIQTGWNPLPGAADSIWKELSIFSISDETTHSSCIANPLLVANHGALAMGMTSAPPPGMSVGVEL